MAKPTLDEHDHMPDIVGSSDFRLSFSNVPGSLGIDISKVALNITQAVIPGLTINPVEQRFAGGHKLKYAMTATPGSGTAAIQFIERVDAQSIILLTNWFKFVRGIRSGNAQGYKHDYAVTGRLEVFDGPGKVVMEILYRNMFIQEFPEVTLDSTSEAQQILYAASFSYDWWELVGQDLG